MGLQNCVSPPCGLAMRREQSCCLPQFGSFYRNLSSQHVLISVYGGEKKSTQCTARGTKQLQPCLCCLPLMLQLSSVMNMSVPINVSQSEQKFKTISPEQTDREVSRCLLSTVGVLTLENSQQLSLSKCYNSYEKNVWSEDRPNKKPIFQITGVTKGQERSVGQNPTSTKMCKYLFPLHVIQGLPMPFSIPSSSQTVRDISWTMTLFLSFTQFEQLKKLH